MNPEGAGHVQAAFQDLDVPRRLCRAAWPLEGLPLPTLCYNLREAPRPGERNPEYAGKLQSVLRKLDFPADYVASVA